MALSAEAKQRAAAMGTRAGQDWRRTGIPSANPFHNANPELAQAWRRGYFHAAK